MMSWMNKDHQRNTTWSFLMLSIAAAMMKPGKYSISGFRRQLLRGDCSRRPDGSFPMLMCAFTTWDAKDAASRPIISSCSPSLYPEDTRIPGLNVQ